MEKLKQELLELIQRFDSPDEFRARLENLISVYPFSEYEYIISHLLAESKITLEEYENLRQAYIDRNLYLPIFEISAPRGFGDTWACGLLMQIAPALKRPSKKLDAKYSGEYDLWLDPGIKIEVKASRAVDSESDAPLYIKALSSDSKRPFHMNFQQLKPDLCHVFVWVAVWRDQIRYWVMSAEEVKQHPHYSPGQHRGNVGEGQLHVYDSTIHAFDEYATQSDQVLVAIRGAYKTWKRQRPKK